MSRRWAYRSPDKAVYLDTLEVFPRPGRLRRFVLWLLPAKRVKP